MQLESKVDAQIATPSVLRIESQQLGAVDVPADQVLHFPGGIPGFLAAHRFCLLQVRAGSRFQLLQCVDDPTLAFVVTDPLLVEPAYPMARIRELAMGVIGLLPDEPIGLAAVVSVPPPPAPMTLNLLAPLVIGAISRRGVQLVLHDSGYQTRHALG